MLFRSGDFTSSVFYTQFKLDSLKLVNDKALIDLNYRPKINAFADAGFNSSLAFTPYKNIGASAGLTLSIPLYDGKQKKIQYSKIDIQERTRLSKKEFFIQQRRQQILQLIQQLRSTDDMIDLINKHFPHSLTDPKKRPILAGNSIMQDRLFIDKYFLKLASRLHYRMVDVSSWKVIVNNKFNIEYKKQNAHRALDDIRESMGELRFYLDKINTTKK